MAKYKNEYLVGDKLLVSMPKEIRDISQGSEEFYLNLVEWVNKFERKGLKFLCIDYFGMCWFRVK